MFIGKGSSNALAIFYTDGWVKLSHMWGWNILPCVTYVKLCDICPNLHLYDCKDDEYQVNKCVNAFSSEFCFGVLVLVGDKICVDF